MIPSTTSNPTGVASQMESEMSPVRLYIETLRISSEILDDCPDSLSDEDFWEVVGRYFVGLVVRLEAHDGISLWSTAAIELRKFRQQYARSIGQPNAEEVLGEYTFDEQGLFVRLLGHLAAYAQSKELQLH